MMQNVGETYGVIGVCQGVGLGLGSQLPKTLLTSLDGEESPMMPANVNCVKIKCKIITIYDRKKYQRAKRQVKTMH